jgi:hypothetical protein
LTKINMHPNLKKKKYLAWEILHSEPNHIMRELKEELLFSFWRSV